MTSSAADSELKARHRAMWASGDYPSMVETFLLPLGPTLVQACGIGPEMSVLDVAAGTGNASIPAAKAGAKVTASDLTPELFDAGRERAEAEDVQLDSVEADAEISRSRTRRSTSSSRASSSSTYADRYRPWLRCTEP